MATFPIGEVLAAPTSTYFTSESKVPLMLTALNPEVSPKPAGLVKIEEASSKPPEKVLPKLKEGKSC